MGGWGEKGTHCELNATIAAQESEELVTKGTRQTHPIENATIKMMDYKNASATSSFTSERTTLTRTNTFVQP